MMSPSVLNFTIITKKNFKNKNLNIKIKKKKKATFPSFEVW